LIGDKVRANEFDIMVGKRQVQKCAELGLGDSLLDVGCGIGMFTPIYLTGFRRVVGLDSDKEHLEEALKQRNNVEYIEGWGETFELDEKFDTITMTNLLEHVDSPEVVLRNCKRHLKPGGRIIAQVPNSESVTRKIGVSMGLIDSTEDISEKERDFYGHKRIYTLRSLEKDVIDAGLRVVDSGGFFYKPLPNEMLYEICSGRGEEWTFNFMNALVTLGEERPQDCAALYVLCE